MHRKPTDAQRIVLLQLVNGELPWHHLRTMSDHGGAHATLRAMVKRGWLTWESELTPKGREVALSLVGGGK